MKGVVSAALFLGLAVGVHLAVAAAVLRDSAEGTSAAGEGGDALLTLQASNVAVAAMVADWERPRAAPLDRPVAQVAAPQVPHATDVALSVSEAAPQVAAVPMPIPAAPQQEVAFDAPSAPSVPAPREAPKPDEPDDTPPTKIVPKPRPETAQVVPVKDPVKAPVTQPATQGGDHASEKARAAGTGGGPKAGAARTTQGAGLSTAQRQSVLASWGGQIRARIERRKRAPRGAGGGVVMLAISVSKDGGLIGVRVQRSSGSSTLDKAAIDAVKRVRKFPAAPKKFDRARADFSLPIRFAG